MGFSVDGDALTKNGETFALKIEKCGIIDNFSK